MVTVTLERVISAMQKNEMAFWILKDGRTTVEMMQDSETDIDASIQLLREVMSQVSGQFIDIIISNKSNSEKAKGGKAYLNYDYRIKLAASPGLHGSNELQGGVIGLLKEIGNLQSKLIEQKYEALIEKLTQKHAMNGAEKLHPLMEKGINVLADIAERIELPFLKSKVPSPLAGPPETEVVKTNGTRKRSKEENQILVNAIDILSSVDPDFTNTLTKLATFAKNDPKKYLSFIPLIP